MANKTRQSNTGSAELYGSNPDSPFLRLKERKKKKAIGWDDLEPDLLTRTTARVTDGGCLCSYSKTSDGGALHLFVKNGAEVHEGYYSNVEEATAALMELYEAFE